MVFKPTSKSNRVLIVDFNHMAHNFSYSGTRLTRTIKVGNNVETIDTTIANGSIKNIFNWSKGGQFPTIVCFDRPCPSRKAYFIKEQPQGVDGEYKGKRESMSGTMFSGVSLAQDLLERGGVPCLYMNNWEADDLIFLAIEKAKELYPNHYIDLVTNDADMLPLVDKQVSVFFRSKKFTWAESKDLEKNRYIQVTPFNFQETVEGLSSFKGMYVPYNSLLLYKILRGDSADGIVSPFKKGTMTPRRLATMVWQMENGKLKKGYKLLFPKGSNQPEGIEDTSCGEPWYFDYVEDVHGVAERCFELNADGEPIKADMYNLFKYTMTTKKFINNNTGEELTLEEAKALGREGGAEVVFEDSELLDAMCKTLSTFGLTDEEVETFKLQYRGMNLAQPFPNLPKEIRRTSLKLGGFERYNGRKLNSVVNALGINLNSKYL